MLNNHFQEGTLSKNITTILFAVLIFVNPVASRSTQSSPNSFVEENKWDGTLRRIQVPILMYHYVGILPTEADTTRIKLTVSPGIFLAHLRYLQEQGYTTISFYELDAALKQGSSLPHRPIILTFDDGYIDHYITVFPALSSFGFTGTFFIITGRADAHDPRYMTWEQIQEMAQAGMSMESHTKTHSDLQNRDRDSLVYELQGSFESLQYYTGRSSRIFAYPAGRYDDMTMQVLRELSVWMAVSTRPGNLHTTNNRLETPRLRISGEMTVGQLAALLQRG
jgi:peptidoglycan/xylan/chitin deacetylase (PgdA/CDA1 family)